MLRNIFCLYRAFNKILQKRYKPYPLYNDTAIALSKDKKDINIQSEIRRCAYCAF